MVVPASDAALLYGGYFDRRDPRAPRFAWPGTHIAARFRGSSVSARFTDIPLEDDTRETDWLAIAIDDAPPRALQLAEGTHEYPLASTLSAGSHRLTIWKRTEAEVGTITFHGLTLSPRGALEPIERPARRMLFVGDSVTAGYGDEGPDGNCHWSATRENNYATYGALAARQLNAEYVAAAWSGKGLTRNYEARDVATLPELYRRVIPTDEASPEVPHEATDVVLLNVGTNDFVRGIPAKKTFVAAYRALVDALRAQHPRALILLQVGPMLADDFPQPRARSLMREWVVSVHAARKAAGDERCEIFEVWIDPKEGVGCDFHPNLTTHARLGRELVELVRSKLDW